MKSTKKALTLSVLSLVLCFTMLLGTTYAWFTDSVTSGKNRIVAGNLDIDVKHTNAKVTTAESINGKTNLFYDINGNEMLWEPGAVSFENFTVENLGTLAFKYNLALAVADYNAVSGTGKTLKEILKVKVLTGENIITTVTRDAVAALDWTTSDSIDDFKKDNGKLYPAGTSGKDSTETFQVIIYWEPSDNDNEWNVNNGKTTTDGQPLFIDFGINVVAAQLDYESDSFDEKYDEDTLLPTLPKSINKEFKSAPISGTTYEGSESVTVVNKNENDATVATVPAGAVKAIVEKMAENIETKDGTDITTVLTLSISTTEATETKASYNIDLTALMTYTDTDGNAQQKSLTTEEVDDLLGENIVVATINIGSDLVNVTVKHADADMTKLESAEQNAEGFFYSRSDGILTIKTCSFSPFEIEFEIPEVIKELKIDGQYMTFASFRDSVNAGETYEGKTITLVSDLDLGGEEWTPIGTSTHGRTVNGYGFKGIFDGNGHTISNLTVTAAGRWGDDGIGLFNSLDGGTIKNLTLSNAKIDGTKGNIKSAAFVVAFVRNGGTVSNVTVDNKSTLDGVEGLGIVGRIYDEGSVENLVNNAKYVKGSGSNVAGIVGAAYYSATGKNMTITNCTNNAPITGANSGAAGIVGLSAADVIGCTNNATVTTTGTGTVGSAGGIVGEQVNCGKVENCSNSGAVSGSVAVGGLIGWVRYHGGASYEKVSVIEVTGCDNSANIASTGSSSAGAGGLVGIVYNAGTIKECENTAATISCENAASGLVGMFQENSDSSFYNTSKLVITDNETAQSAITGQFRATLVYDNTQGAYTDISGNNYQNYQTQTAEELVFTPVE